MTDSRETDTAELPAADAGRQHRPAASSALVSELARNQAAAPNTTRSFWKRGLSFFLATAAWIVALSLLVVAVLRVLYHDGTYVLIWMNAFTRYVYLPAYISLSFAAWQRRWRLALVSAIVVGCHLYWLAPDFLRDRRFDVPASTGSAESAAASPMVRIFFANVRENNEQFASMLQEITDADPDIIVLVEYGWGWHLTLKTSPIMAPYKYGSGHLQSHIGSVNVFSRLPLKTEMQSWIGGRPMHTIDVELGAQTLRVIGLHAPRPMNRPQYNYYKYWEEMTPLLVSQPGPVVIVGDFNATPHSRPYQQLTAHRLRSAHRDRGRGYATTWPNGFYLVPPIRIDQVLLSPEVECVSIREGFGRDSDHKPLVVDVRIRHGASRSTELPSRGTD